MPQYCSNCNINYKEGRYCRRCGKLLVETNDSQRQDQVTQTVKKPSKLPPAILIFHAVAYSAMMFNLASASGNWEEILNIPMWAGLVAVSFIFMFISKSSMVSRLILLFTALLLPYLLFFLVPAFKPFFAPAVNLVHTIQRNRERSSYEAAKQAGFKHLKEVFKEPQKVANVHRSYIELENGLCLDLRLEHIGPLEEIQDYLKTRLIGRNIKVAIPTPAAGSTDYLPGRHISRCRNVEEYIEYDLIPAYVYLGDEFLNATIVRKWRPNGDERYILGLTAEAKKCAAATDDK